ncbi:hypothetical protein [Tenacibaculum agarivorans]|uniref:hypothetical protein n=1 Tax=Tenacibaculum agarivorans TaxID=1908389 RepID=UPI00094B8AFA|nr:hypothetical protein [Tenacibaculum agarivorans]
MKHIQTLVFGLSLAFFMSCADAEFTPIEDEQSNQDQQGGNDQNDQEELIFAFDFEQGNEDFVTHSSGDFPANEPVNDRGQVDNTCGTLFRGKTEDFTPWRGYDFKGNETNFMGLDMGACEGFFEAVVETSFYLEESLEQGEATLSFKYYMPGNFTGWDNSYIMNVIIEYANSNNDFSNDPNFEDVLVRFSPEVNQDGWVDFSEVIPTSIDAGEYSVIVRIVGASAAIDDIKLTKPVGNNDQDDNGDNDGQDGDNDQDDNGDNDGQDGDNDQDDNGDNDGQDGDNDQGNGDNDGQDGDNDQDDNGDNDGQDGDNDQDDNGDNDGQDGNNDQGNGDNDGQDGDNDQDNDGQNGENDNDQDDEDENQGN